MKKMMNFNNIKIECMNKSISIDDNTTNIDMQTDSTNDSITNSNWYTLDGRKLDERPTKKGVYINNGKKVVVK